MKQFGQEVLSVVSVRNGIGGDRTNECTVQPSDNWNEKHLQLSAFVGGDGTIMGLPGV